MILDSHIIFISFQQKYFILELNAAKSPMYSVSQNGLGVANMNLSVKSIISLDPDDKKLSEMNTATIWMIEIPFVSCF